MNTSHFRKTSKLHVKDRNPYSDYVEERFGPITAVVTKNIVGGSSELGTIKYHGGCYAKALTYEETVLAVGTKVKVLGRVRDQNIWAVSELPPF